MKNINITERKAAMKKLTLGVLILAMSILLATGSSLAATVDVYLYAGTTTKTMPDGTSVTLWGFALEADNVFTTLEGIVEVPGPRISVSAGDTLNIHLHNTLTDPVSVIVPGQITSMVPTWTDDSTGARGGDLTKRVRSFTQETANLATTTYTWTNVKAGTYLYQSGTHPAVQVQMGLYGALTIDAAANNVYNDASSAYLSEAVLIYSEIDPVIANAVATGTYGTPPNPTSTVDYAPKYFLVNGMPFPAGSPIPAGNVSEALLLRFLNAGLKSHVPALEGAGHMSVIAEDGNLYPYQKTQYSVLLPAGKTVDAILTPGSSGYIPVFDRSLSLANYMMPGGGMLSYLNVGASGITNTLTVSKDGPGTGTVESGAPGGISCGVDCTEVYSQGTSVVLSPSPDAGSTFLRWSGDCTGSTDCTVSMTIDRSVNATFGYLSSTSHIGVVRNGWWYLDSNGTLGWQEGADTTFSFSVSPSEIPVTGDWDGLGGTEVGVFDGGWWYLDTDGTAGWNAGTDTSMEFGISTDTPVTGDWDGDGDTNVGLFRSGWWYLDSDGTPGWNVGTDTSMSYGISTDIPVTGDWDGNGDTNVGLYRNGWWYLDSDGTQGWNAGTDTAILFGMAGDDPVTGDWDGDGITDIGVFRNGWWYLDSDGTLGWNSATDTAIRFGITGDDPVTGAW
jgi:FtsP/CotA-like multicopper oxidase with cupredoxin domain